VGRIPDKWKDGGYLKPARIPKDPWGKEFLYFSPGNEGVSTRSFLWADNEQGGEGKNADIESWKIE